MAIITGSALFKDAQGNTTRINGLSDNDIAKIKDYHSKVDTLEQKVAASNAGQRQLAYKDYYTVDTNDAEMTPGTYYIVPFNAQGQFLEFDEETGKPKNPQTDTAVTDLAVSYYEIVYKSEAGTKAKLGRQNANVSLANVLYDNKDATVTSHFTFNQDVDMIATQDVDTLGDTKLASAKFVRDLTAKKISEAGHLTGKYYTTGAPDESALIVNEIAFYTATDLL